MICELVALIRIAAFAGGTCEVPFRIARGCLEARATVGAHTGWFMLDSGADMSFLRPEIARAAGVADETTSTWFGRPSTTSGIVATVRLGGARLSNIRVCEFLPPGLQGMITGGDVQCDGIIGYNALRMVSLAVDFEQVRCWVSGPTEGDEAARVVFGGEPIRKIPLTVSEGIGPIAQVEAPGGQVPALADLGCTLGCLPKAVSEQMRGQAIRGPSRSVNLFDETGTAGTVIPDYIGLGGARILSPTFVEPPPRYGSVCLGWSLFAPFGRALFDFDGGLIAVPNLSTVSGALQPLAGLFGAVAIGGQRGYLGVQTASSVRRVPIASIRSINGVPAGSLFSVQGSDRGVRGAAVAALISTSGDPVQLDWRDSRGRHTLSSNGRPWFGPAVSANSGTEGAPRFEQGPGYYLVSLKNPGETTFLAPSSTAFVLSQASGYRIVQVGGLPSPTLRAVPNEPRLLRFEVPPVGQPSGLVILAVAGQVLAVPRGTTIINPNGTVTKIPPRGP